jgi:hypothetical protein
MFDEMRSLVGRDDRFLFYWSGHGTQFVRSDNGAAYGFLPLFASKVSQFSSMVSMDDISRWNSYLEARHALFILDACLSGLAGANPKSDPRLDQLSLPARFDDIQQRIVIEKQRAGWREQLTPQLKDLQGGGGAFFFTAAGIAPGTREAPAKPQPSKATPKSGVGIPAAHTSGDVPRSPVTDGNSEEFALARGQSKLVTKDKIVMAVIGHPFAGNGPLMGVRLAGQVKQLSVGSSVQFSYSEGACSITLLELLDNGGGRFYLRC